MSRPALRSPVHRPTLGAQDPTYWDFLGDSLTSRRWTPFKRQRQIYDLMPIPWDRKPKHPRIVGLCCGRRWGKTTLLEKLLWRAIMADPDDYGRPPTVQMTADTEDHCMKVWRPFIHHARNTELNALVADYDPEFEILTLHTGATAQMLSSYNPQAMASSGVSTWIVDEAQYVSQAAFDNMRPTISDRAGAIIMAGVAQGEGPFKEVCILGDDDAYPEYLHLNAPSSTNPFIPAEEIEFQRRTMPPHLFKQLYLAEWVNELGKVFWNVEGCIDGDEIHVHPKGWGYTHPPQRGHVYYGGLDLARLQDYTVYTIWDRYGRLVAWDRFNLISWQLQRARIMELSAWFGHPLTVTDSTGIGDPIFESLLDMGFNGMEYKINSNQSKRQLIDELAVRIGGGELRYPKLPNMIRELTRMEAKQSDNSMMVRYEAPVGGHDDWVISLALAQQVLPRPAQKIVKPSPLVASLQDDLYEDRQVDAYEFL